MNLNEPYNREQFISFLEKFLPDYVNDQEDILTNKQYKYIRTIKRLGISNELNLKVYEVLHSSENDPRVSISREIFNFLKAYSVTQALVIFKSDKSENYRLSLITFKVSWTEGNKVNSEPSNPRRFSYFLGPDAKTNTPYQFLIKKGQVANLEDLKSRFSIEVVNKEFYRKISEHFIKLVGGTLKKGRKKTDYKPQLKLPSVKEQSQASLEFGVRLIGRIIFCWFLKEKKSSYGTSLMPEELLSLAAIKNNSDYYHKILEPIFFEVLNQPLNKRDDQFYDEPYSLIPYLNGGLFSQHKPDDYYERKKGELQSRYHNSLVIPDEWFLELFKTLETYNFTIDENSSFDEELSIDPEMLGRIFENLLAEIDPATGESARKSTGSYYTPRVIVDYMVDESLLLYLKTGTAIDERKLKAILSYNLIDDEEYPISAEERQKIADAFENLKILDPACGSGAFPIGVLQKMVFVLQQIDPNGEMWFKKQLKNTDPEFRRDIKKRFENKEYDYIRKLGLIRKCIYGVDIQPIATEISRLRCFLTLIVDQSVRDDTENRGLRSLPNLEFKFVTANTLIGLPKRDPEQQSLLDNFDLIDELKEIRDLYFDAPSTEREMLKSDFYQKQKQIFKDLEKQHGWSGIAKAELSRKLTDWDPFSHKSNPWFDSEWMFGLKEGFDIVIANPPYVGEKGHKETFQEIKRSFLGNFYFGKMDLFYFFFHLALNVCSDKGIITFITTNYYLTATGAKKLRKDFKERSVIKELVNFNELRVFESARGQHNMISILQKSNDENIFAKTSTTKREGTAKKETLEQILNRHDKKTEYFEVKQNDLYDGKDCYIRLLGRTGISENSVQVILEKAKNEGELLGVLCNVNTGLYTAADDIFILEDEKKNMLFPNLNDLEKSLFRPLFKNSDIRKFYTALKTNKKVIYHYEKAEYSLDKIPNILDYLKKHKERLTKRKDNSLKGALKRGRWDVMSLPKTAIDFNESKIVAPQRSPTNTFGYNEIPWYASADVYFITQKEMSVSLKYILALLNSKLYYLWLYHRGKRKGDTLELYQKPLSEIPIKKISPEEQKPFINIVDKILVITKNEGYLENFEKQKEVKAYADQIDQMVYELYELTPEEIAIIEGKKK